MSSHAQIGQQEAEKQQMKVNVVVEVVEVVSAQMP